MSLQPKHLVIALSFVLGVVASSFGQNSVVKNPFVKQSTESTFKSVKAAHETGKITNTQLNKPRSTEELKPIANTDSPLNGFEYFVPESADMLLVLRPQQRIRSELFSFLESNSGLGMVANDWPLQSEQIEWVVAATSQRVIQQSQRSFQQNIYRAIKSSLDGDGDGQQPKKQRSIANDLNEDTCCLIRFTEPTEIELFGKLLDVKNDKCGEYQASKWLGRETLDCGCADCCVVVRLNEKTFLIGNKEHLGAAFHSQQPTSPMIANWARELAKSNFRGEVFLGVDISKTDWGAFPFPETDERVALVKAIKSVALTVDLKTNKLLGCTAGCENVDSAGKIKTLMEEGLAMYLDTVDQWMAKMSGPTGADANVSNMETKDQMVELVRSIKFAQNESNLTITLPRPDGFTEMLKTMASEQARFRQQAYADFETAHTKVEMKPVLTWKNKVKKGSKIRPADVTVEQWPAELVPEDAFQDTSEVVGKNLKRGTFPGQPIMDHDFEPVTQ